MGEGNVEGERKKNGRIASLFSEQNAPSYVTLKPISAHVIKAAFGSSGPHVPLDTTWASR